MKRLILATMTVILGALMDILAKMKEFIVRHKDWPASLRRTKICSRKSDAIRIAIKDAKIVSKGVVRTKSKQGVKKKPIEP